MKSSVKAHKSSPAALATTRAGNHAAPRATAHPVATDSPERPPSGSVTRASGARTQPVCFEWSFPGANQVCIVGTFNNWQPNATPLKPCGAGRWLLDVALQPGRYEYRFVVDGRWMDDPESEGCGPNPAGGHNSLLVV